MILYHATDMKNLESIKENGLEASLTDKISNSDNRIDLEGVFGFIDEKNAYDFGRDNYEEFVIVTFKADAEDVIDDPEYDGEAKFYETSNNVNVVNVVE